MALLTLEEQTFQTTRTRVSWAAADLRTDIYNQPGASPRPGAADTAENRGASPKAKTQSAPSDLAHLRPDFPGVHQQ